MKCIAVSSSIENFREKLQRKYPDRYMWNAFVPFFPTIFFGAYHWVDYLRIWLHFGKRTIFWCGSDIMYLGLSPFGQWIIRGIKADHVCENAIEQVRLERMGIQARLHPMLFDHEALKLPISYKQSKKPDVFLTSHPDGESYGVGIVESIAQKVPGVTFHIFGIYGRTHDNVIYHGLVSNERFNAQISQYQGALRLNDFDGFSESVAKSLIMGQYPISKIYYPHTTYIANNEQLIEALNDLKNKKKPNVEGRNYWLEKLSNPV